MHAFYDELFDAGIFKRRLGLINLIDDMEPPDGMDSSELQNCRSNLGCHYQC